MKGKPQSPIIVNLNSTLKKGNIITAARTFNKNKKPVDRLNTSSLKMDGPATPIYVAESLTKKAKHLHYLARIFAKDYKYESCWTSYGKVYIQRNKEESRILIDGEETLEKLKTAK